jgi:CRISPR-associated protein Cst1
MPYLKWTGNPFVDGGIAAIVKYCKKSKPEDIILDDINKVRSEVENLYIQDSWVKSLNIVFTSNAPITNPKHNTKKKLKNFQNVLNNLIDNFSEFKNSGDCIACGSRDTKSQKNRMHVPMAGYESSHYFSYTTKGVDYCDVCAFCVQVLPLVLIQCGGFMALLNTNDEKILLSYAKENIKSIREQISSGNYTGAFNMGYSNPRNALFEICIDLIQKYYDYEWEKRNVFLRLVYFSNFTKLPEKPLEFIDLPSNVFKFLLCMRHNEYKVAFEKVVKRNYYDYEKIKGQVEIKNYYKKIKGKTADKYKYNVIYDRLLKNQSIISLFLYRKKKIIYVKWELLEIYLKEVLFMDKRRIEVIKTLASNISELIKKNANGLRRLNQLDYASNYNSFRTVLLKIVKEWVNLKKDKPLICLDDYIESLFPEGALGWRETQDLILFGIYENSHEWLISKGEVIEVEDEEDEIEENDI